MASSAALTTTNLPHFRSLLHEWETAQPPPSGFTSPIPSHVPSDEQQQEVSRKDVVVAFRTRPPLPDEAQLKFASESKDGEAGEGIGNEDGAPANVEFCAGVSVTSAEPGVFVAHVPGMKWTGPTLTHKSYSADLAFGPSIDNEEVYQRLVTANDLIPLVLAGGVGCILAYGQTGSGKTFTMEGLEQRVARDLFDVARLEGRRLLLAEKSTARGDDSNKETHPEGDANVFEFSVTFLELLGRRAIDLVEASDEVDAHGNPVRKEVSIHEDKVGEVRPRLVSTTVTSSVELRELITSALAHRRTSATLRNATSSRSHAVLTIRVKNRLLPYAEEGQLILVDLAGSERYEDSKAHDKERMNEARDNNKSLMNLKECVRAKAKMAEEDGFVHIPWRSNKLTMVLKPIFDIESRQLSKTVIIAHVSPHIQDTVHSATTLGYASPFRTSLPKRRGPAPYDPKDPRTWSHADTVTWFTNEFTKRAQTQRQLAWNVRSKAAAMNGRKLRPLDPAEPLELAVDVAALCPPGKTARHFGAMYTTEFLRLCLAASPAIARGAGRNDTDMVKNTSVEVIGQLFNLVLTAKTRTRNDIMRSRKRLSEDATYGEAPKRYIVGTDQEWTHYSMAEGYLDARIFFGDRWDESINAAIVKAREANVDVSKAMDLVIREMMDEWRAMKAKGGEPEPETA